MRMNRLDWLAQFLLPPKPRKRLPREKQPKRQPKKFVVRMSDGIKFKATAFTKSEARAQAKKHFRVAGRLPIGSFVQAA